MENLVEVGKEVCERMTQAYKSYESEKEKLEKIRNELAKEALNIQFVVITDQSVADGSEYNQEFGRMSKGSVEEIILYTKEYIQSAETIEEKRERKSQNKKIRESFSRTLEKFQVMLVIGRCQDCGSDILNNPEMDWSQFHKDNPEKIIILVNLCLGIYGAKVLTPLGETRLEFQDLRR